MGPVRGEGFYPRIPRMNAKKVHLKMNPLTSPPTHDVFVGRLIETSKSPETWFLRWIPVGFRTGFSSGAHRSLKFTRWAIHGSFCVTSLVFLLAVLAAIPLLQLIALGYLLSVAGRLAKGGTFRDALPGFDQAGQMGLAVLAVMLAALPTQLLTHWESVAALIDPGSGQANQLRGYAIGASMLATGYLLWAWARGGRWGDYVWPAPRRFFREGFRWATWKTMPDRLGDFTISLNLPQYFWLGLRGAVGTLIWLIPAMILVAAFRGGETGLAGFVAVLSLGVLGISLLYLPMLQVHFAAENRWSALFEVRTIRRDFRRAPWAWLVAMVLSMVVFPLPLYLLKIEATQQEVMWLPCLVFIAFSLPARIATGLALRRARRQPEPVGKWATTSRWLVSLVDASGRGSLFVFCLRFPVHQLGRADDVGRATRDPGSRPLLQRNLALQPNPQRNLFGQRGFCFYDRMLGPSFSPRFHCTLVFNMPPRHLNVILITAAISLLCYFTHRRTRSAMLVGDALNLIDAYYVDPVDRTELLTSAMSGLTEGLDEHTEYISNEAYETFQDSIHQEFAGIGIYVEPSPEEGPVRVVTPLVGSPALAAGLLPGDEIMQVDGEDVSSLSLREVSLRLKGPIGTTVRLTVRRKDEQIEVSIERGRIELESIVGDYRDDQNAWVFRLRDDDSMAYLRLTSFGEKNGR